MHLFTYFNFQNTSIIKNINAIFHHNVIHLETKMRLCINTWFCTVCKRGWCSLSQSECRITAENQQCKSRTGRIINVAKGFVYTKFNKLEILTWNTSNNVTINIYKVCPIHHVGMYDTHMKRMVNVILSIPHLLISTCLCIFHSENCCFLRPKRV